MRPLVSVIVPVYKVEDYLEECVDSVLGQTYEKIELILVDDGSPDRCGEMCDAYAEKDRRVRVIHKKNGGLSSARNAGMAEAKGDFYTFVDSDDYIRTDAVEILVLHALKNQADIVCADHQSFLDGSCPKEEEEKKAPVLYDRLSAMDAFALCDWGAWAKLYRRQVHEGICFPEGKIHEDEAIMFRILDRCSRILCISDRLYYYRQRAGSITSVSYSLKKMDWTDGWMENVRYVQKKYPAVCSKCLSKAWTTAMYNIGHLIGKEEYRQELNRIRSFVLEYKKMLFADPYISGAGKLRAALFLLSDPCSKHSIYIHFYRNLERRRRRRNEK